MSLAPDERRALAEIEESLYASEPELAAKMATFAALTSGEKVPRWKWLSPWRLRLKRIIKLAIALALLGLLIVAAMHTGSGAGLSGVPGR